MDHRALKDNQVGSSINNDAHFVPQTIVDMFNHRRAWPAAIMPDAFLSVFRNGRINTPTPCNAWVSSNLVKRDDRAWSWMKRER